MPGKISKIKGNPKDIQEKLSINRNKGTVKLSATLLKYRDKDTRQIICFIPSLQLTGYGATDEKAQEMIEFSVDEYLKSLLALSQTKLDAELKQLGWQNVPFAHKQFSHVFINSDGELENYNAVADEVERLTLQV